MKYFRSNMDQADIPLLYIREIPHGIIAKFLLRAYTEETSFTNFDYKQFNIYGLSCQYVKLGLSDEITEDQAKTLYSNYVQLRTEKRGEESGEVEMHIYTPDTIFFVTKDGITTDVQTPIEILPAETTK